MQQLAASSFSLSGAWRRFLSAAPRFCQAPFMRSEVASPVSTWASWEGRLVLALALFAGLRVLVFSLAFPFFSNVDEYRHFDVVLKYARGYWPSPGPDRYEPETAWFVGRFGSPEYHRDRVDPAEPGLPLPAWRQPDAVSEHRVAQMRAYLGGRHSLEADQPPVYYATAGAWFALGRSLGIEGLHLLYWVRALGALVGFGLVFGTWWLLRDLYAESALVRLGTPLLLACFPQDALYYVTGDVFSPLLGGLGFLLVLRLSRRPESAAGAYLGAGLVAAAAFLCKYPSVAIAVACAFCSVAAWRAPAAERAPIRLWGRWALFWAAFLLPALFWLLRNQLLGGDLTGTAFKVERLGWGQKSLAEYLDHPIFTPAGAATFVTDLIPCFWRGELVWYRDELAWPAADLVYTVSTLIFLPLAVLGLWRRGRPRALRVAEGAALVAVLAGGAVLALFSLLFVFGETTSPSAAYPYFVQGRLISGVLVPFALLYLRGLEEATSRLPAGWAAPGGWGVLGALVALTLVSEALLTAPVFLSLYNGFHLP
jgi:hypothetical protein